MGALRDMKLINKLALGFFALLVLVAICAPLVAHQSPFASDIPAQAPSAAHWFGTDRVGRDVFSRVIYGARGSLLIGLFSTLFALILAAVVGSIAATSRKWVSEVVMRILDIIMAFPGIALVAVFVAVFGSSLVTLVAAMGFVYFPQLARVIRANVLAQMGEDYVNASKVMGASTAWILFKHVARNCLAPILVFATVLVADAIVLEASLSFINAGIQPPTPSWGNILSEGKQLLLSGYWWPTFFPGLMILLTTLALNILSEGVTDAFASPRIRTTVDVEGDEQRGNASAVDANVQVLGAVDEEQIRRHLIDALGKLRATEGARSDRQVFAGSHTEPLLDVNDLKVAFPAAHGDVDIVDGISFSIRPGETMGLVGESGSGKSVTSMAIMGLLGKSARVQGEALLHGQNLLTMNQRQLNTLRGREIAMIYQDALSSLNPAMLIKAQMKQLTVRGGTRSAEELLELVGLDAQRTLRSYPHELSGGQRQRVLIAMALTRDPKLVIADEPTTALDVTVQKQVVELLNRLRDELGFAMLFVSHDLALVAQLAHKITVMYAGQVVEQAPTDQLLRDPRHEYTQGLLGSVLSIEAQADRLHQIRGTVPAPRDFLDGDRFAPRSSHPDQGLHTKPQLHLIPDTQHLVASTNGHIPPSLTLAGSVEESGR